MWSEETKSKRGRDRNKESEKGVIKSVRVKQGRFTAGKWP